MPMPLTEDVEIRAARAEDRPALQRMLELYQYELSDLWDQDLDAHGEYGYALGRFWSTNDCHAFVATVAGHYAGFALADGAVKVGRSGNWMDQFFVLKKYRRGGVGAALARHVFDAMPGRWEVGQMPDNLAAQAFWRRVIAQYTGGAFTETVLTSGWWQGVVQLFDAGSP
jgi:predicted acetyltransferase